MRIVCISDTHLRHEGWSVPAGDLLIHAGDLTRRGGLDEIAAADAWLGSLPHRHKVIVAGNHDFGFEQRPDEARARVRSALYLEDAAATVEGLRIWGSPWQPWFMDWAFNLRRGAEIRARWDLIPDGIDVLVTHGPRPGSSKE
jgi:3',5'-cyclic AMP phosphodiesterase CpdA